MRTGVVNDELGGRPRDAAQYPGLAGNGRWALDIYYHLLNCGVRLPPTAGSGSGWMPRSTAQSGSTAALKAAASGNVNPLGYNRVYVFVDGQLTWDKWWEGLRAGRTVVTNGPLIRPSVEGQPPGYVFQADRGQTLELEIGLTLSTRDKISYLEIIKNGAVEHTIRLDQWKENGGKLPLVKFNDSGWFLIRAVADEPNTYRFAMTAPYYVEIGYQPHISRTRRAVLYRLVPRANPDDRRGHDWRSASNERQFPSPHFWERAKTRRGARVLAIGRSVLDRRLEARQLAIVLCGSFCQPHPTDSQLIYIARSLPQTRRRIPHSPIHSRSPPSKTPPARFALG